MAYELLVVAGESSGDLHGARLLAELRSRLPELRAFGLGGDEMAATGFDAVAHSSEIAVVGLTEALRILPRAWTIFRDLLAEVDRRGARVAVLIDAPDFNLRLAKKLRRRGVRVVYYISPQLWGWRTGRVKAVARDVEKMLVLFPFEVGFYEKHGVEAIHVGHPLVDEVPRLESIWERPDDDGVGSSKTPPKTPRTLALLPGSRRSEVRALLPTMLETARRMAVERPLDVRLIEAANVPQELFDEILGNGGIAVERIPQAERFAAIAGSHLALCASGTATLEVGLIGTPMMVIYRLSPWTAWLARRLVKLPTFAMVNLVLDDDVVPERFQEATEPKRLAPEALALLADRKRIDRMRDRLGELRSRLGEAGGASRHAAAEVAAVLESAAVESAEATA